jgi:DNA-directed RNA polymerase subunit N (RpoN/RPB10)
VSNLAVNAGTVTFEVGWGKNTVPSTVKPWSDTVWVFVDYDSAGTMTRLPLLTSGATLTAHTAPGVGEVMEAPGNNTGVWVVGNARSAGSFSATVKLLTATAELPGACAYAVNYPPVGQYTSATDISFTGTPQYDVALKDGSGGTTTLKSGSTFSVPAGYTVDSFTDKTGAPGVLNCFPPTIYDLVVSATAFCAGNSVTFALSNTTSGRTYRLYKDGTAVMNALPGTGGAATFSGTFAGAGVYTAQVVADRGLCGAAMNGAHTIVENPLPAVPTLSQNGPVCAGSYITFTASGGSGSYDWGGYFGGSGNTKTTPTSAGAYIAQVRSVQTSNGITCYSAFTGNVTGTVIVPAGHGQAINSCGCAAGTLNCGGTCLADNNYTTNDGSCTGQCNTAFVQLRNACGTVIHSQYSTYQNTGCTEPNYVTYDGACTGGCNQAYAQLRNACGTVIHSQYSTYQNTGCTEPNYTTNDGACTGQCNTAYVQLRNVCGTVIHSQYGQYENTSCTDGCPATYGYCCNSTTAYVGCNGITAGRNQHALDCQEWCTAQSYKFYMITHRSSAGNCAGPCGSANGCCSGSYCSCCNETVR